MAALLLRLAATLERTAVLAEAHAERERSNEHPHGYAVEVDRASQAWRAAMRARALADAQLAPRNRGATIGSILR